MIIKPDNAAEISVITIYIGSSKNEKALAANLKLGVVAHTTHLSTGKAGGGGSGVQGHPLVSLSKFEATMEYVKTCLKKIFKNYLKRRGRTPERWLSG